MRIHIETPQDRVTAFVLAKNQSSPEIQALITALELHRCRYPSFHETISKDSKVGKSKTESKLAVPGLGSQPGLGIGSLVFDSDTAEKWTKEKNRKVVLILPFQKSDDVHGVIASVGVVTTEGGATSHAAVVTRQFGIPSVVGCSSITLDLEKKLCMVGDVIAYEGDQVIVDGTMGTVFFDLVSKGFQEQELRDVNNTVSEDVFFSFVNEIIVMIRNRMIGSDGAELALYCLLTHIESINDIRKLPELNASFDYLTTLFSRSAKPDPIINLMVRMFKDLFQKVGLLIGATSIEALESIHQEIAKNLSRLNSIASQSVSMRHIMFCLERATKKIDLLTSQYFERQKAGSISQLGPRILIVEDEPYLVQPVLDALENVLNAEILLATTTEEGIAFLEANTIIDILICDIMLPIKDDLSDNPYQGGIAVCEKARDVRGSELPIICLSVVTDATVWNTLRKIGVDIKVNKPVIISEMISIVRETLIAAHHGPKVELVEQEIKHRKLELNDRNPSIRIKALWALYQLGKYDASIFAFIQAINNTEKDDKVKAVALSICTELEKTQQSSVSSKITKFTLKRQD